MLHKHTDKFGDTVGQVFSWSVVGVQENTDEKPSFLLFGVECRTPSESALLLPSSLDPTDVTDYIENWYCHCHQLELLLLHKSRRHSLSTKSVMTGKLNLVHLVHLRLVSEVS